MAIDTASLVDSVTTLSDQYNETISCFDCVQLGRGLGNEFPISLLKLDSAKLRLSRWGKSLGLGNDIRDSEGLKERFGSEPTIKLAEDLLDQIIELFSEAESISNRYKRRTKPDDESLESCDPQTDLDPPLAQLHRGIRRLTSERQKQANAQQKPKWTVYQEKQFRRLIEDITDLVDKLIDLFPASIQSQRDLCDSEVSEIGNNEKISVLRDIATGQDKLLADAFERAASGTQGSYHIVFGKNNSGVQIAHNSGTLSGITFGKSSGGFTWNA